MGCGKRYQELRGYLGKPRKGKPGKAKPDGELTYARYGLWHYVLPEKQKKEPYVSLQRTGANLRGLMRVLLFKRFESSVLAVRRSLDYYLVDCDSIGVSDEARKRRKIKEFEQSCPADIYDECRALVVNAVQAYVGRRG